MISRANKWPAYHLDFGTWRPNILIVMTLIGVAVGFSWLGVYTPDKWITATAIYIIGCEL